MTNIQVKKVSKYILWTYLVVVCLFTIGAYDKLFMKTESGVSRLVFYLPFVALAGGLLFFYTHLLQKNGEKGRRVIGAGFFETIHKYRFLIEQLVTRDFKIKYKRSVLGVFWSFLNPLLMMIVQYIVFSHLLNIRGGVAHYAIYLLCGIVMWNGFNDCSMQSMRSITGNSALITKVYVPKYIYPVTKVFSASVNVLLSMIPLLLVTLVYGLFSTPRLFLKPSVFLLPFGLLFLLVFCIGMGFLLSSLMVFFHDIEFLWTVLSTAWMYATPIIYSLSMFEGKEGVQWIVTLMKFNPLYHYISFVRTIILEGTSPAFSEYLICAAFSAAMFAIGITVFKKCQDKFILYL